MDIDIDLIGAKGSKILKAGKILELGSKISIETPISKGYESILVLREHIYENGKVERTLILPEMQNVSGVDSISFETDKFSKYAVMGSKEDLNSEIKKKFGDSKELPIESLPLPSVAKYIEHSKQKLERIQGKDRYQTALEISKNSFKDDRADTVVIVGANSLLDGLSAALLASAKKATVVLSGKNGLSKESIEEISRCTGDKLGTKKMYIVGGESSVPKSVESILKSKFGADIIRFGGKDRYDTSRMIAEYLIDEGNIGEELFLVGGSGAADAMSIAPVASWNFGRVSPILVVNKNLIDDKYMDIIKNRFSKIYIIGGEGSICQAVETSLKKSMTSKVLRIYGKDRYDTNLRIIDEFYTNLSNKSKIKAEAILLASGQNKYLVDAQTAGAFDGKISAPILLVDKEISENQLQYISKPDGFLIHSRALKNIYVVGGAVSDTALNGLMKKLNI